MPDAADSLDALIDLARDDEPLTRAMAVAGLARTREPRGFAPVLVALFDPVDEVRAAAATALGIYGDTRAYEPLVKCLEDPNPNVGANCVWSLGQLADPRAMDALLAILADRPIPDAAPDPDAAVDPQPDPDAASDLQLDATPELDLDAPPANRPIELRRAAATAIGERASLSGSDLATTTGLIERARAVLLAIADAREEDAELRAACVWTLGHFPPDKQTTGICIELLDDPHEWVVRYSIEALAHFGDLAALEPLEELASSDDPRESVSELAARAVELLHAAVS